MLAFAGVVSPFAGVFLPAQYLAVAERHATTIQYRNSSAADEHLSAGSVLPA